MQAKLNDFGVSFKLEDELSRAQANFLSAEEQKPTARFIQLHIVTCSVFMLIRP